MKKYIFLLLTLSWMVAVLQAEIFVSPWDRGQRELESGIVLPVTYPGTFVREREMFGYAPRFMPAKVTFTPENTPVIRFGVQGEEGGNQMSYASRKYTPGNYIQFLGSNDRWHVTDSHLVAIRTFWGLRTNEVLTVMSGERVPDMVEFDDAGNAYTVVSAKSGSHSGHFLLFSSDQMNSWQVLPLPIQMTLEADLLHNSRNRPPVLVGKDIRGVLLYAPHIDLNGALVLGATVRIAEDPLAVLHMVMAGAGNSSITLGEKTFVVYMSQEKKSGISGTPHYIVSYDNHTGEVGEPYFLGESGNKIDGHNTPVLAADSKGYLHVLLGCHWHSMVYFKSKSPADISAWEGPEYVAGNGDNRWSRNGITYPGFVIDREDTIHLVVRGRNSGFVNADPADPSNNSNWEELLDYALVYFRKKTGGVWEERKDLAIPKHQAYSNWYHKISIDKQGGLFVSYLYYAHALNEEVAREYMAKWPEECREKLPVATFKGILAHDPVLIHSFDGGNTWRITQTEDFLTKNLSEKSACCPGRFE